METLHTPDIQRKEFFYRIDLIIIVLIISIFLLWIFAPMVVNLIIIPPLIAFLAIKIFQRASLFPVFPRKDEYHTILPGWTDTKELSHIFNNSKNFVYAIGGEMDHHVWLEQIVVDAVNNAISRNVNIRMACGPHFDIENVHIAKLANEGKITLYRFNEREEEYHFRINDRLDVLFHLGSDHNKNIFIWYNNLFSGKSYLDYFHEKTTNAQRIEKGMFCHEFHKNFIIIDKTGKRSMANESLEKKFCDALNS
jgi:hypothetical protein